MPDFFGDPPRSYFNETGISIESRADRCPSDIQRIYTRERLPNALDCLIDLRYPAGDQLAEGEWCRVLKVRPPDHDNIAIVLRFFFEYIAQAPERREHLVLDCLHSRNVHCRGKRIVRGLTMIHIIVGMNRLF